MNDELRPSDSSRKRQRILGLFFGAILVIMLVAALIITAKYFNFQDFWRGALIWINHLGPWGPVAFIVSYNLATVLFIPGSILTLGGGAIFGIVLGSVYVLIAATLSAVSAFLISRYLCRSWVAKQIERNPKFKAIDAAVAKEKFKIVLLARLSPVFPFSLLNYAFGVTQITFNDYLLGSIGIIPGTVMYVYLGSLVSDLAMIGTATQATDPQATAAKWLMRVVGFIATIVVTLYLTHVARQALAEKIS